jgi:hypothetical protein
MTTVPPATTPQTQLPTGPAPAPVVQILQPPAAVAALPPGTVLEAVVVPTPPQPGAPADAKPAVTLQTPAGDVQIKLTVQLPDNARVALEVLRAAQQNSATPQVTVRVVTIDNQPAAHVIAQLARQANTAAQTQTPAQPLPATSQNPLLRAVVLPPGMAWTAVGPQQIPALGTISAFITLGLPLVPQQAPAQPGAAQLPTPQMQVPPAPLTPVPATPTPLPLATGSEASVRIIDIQLPRAQGAPAQQPAALPAPQATPMPTPAAPSPPISATATPSAPTAPVVAAPTIATPAAPTPQPGLVLPTPQGLPAAPPQPPVIVQPQPPLATFTGTVVSRSPAGAPVIETESGTLQLNVRANLPIGTRVTVEVAALLEPRAGLPPLPPTPVSSLPLSGPPGMHAGWPTLTESLAVLRRTDPVAAQQLAQAIPDGGPRTAVAAMSFMQAMRSGDARQWPGDMSLRALERAGPRGAHLASQLSDEVAALSTRARDTGTEWRALPLPWSADGQIDRIALITRKEGDSDDDSRKKSGGGGTRFLINLDLSRLGSMQLDGMFRKETRGFDMMIRTKEALPDNIRLDLVGIFANSNAAMGLKGGLTFQVVKKFADPLASGPMGADKSGLWA